MPKGYPTQAERFQKQRRLQRLRAELSRVTADGDDKRVHVTEGGKRLAKTRHNLDAAEPDPVRVARAGGTAPGTASKPLGSGDEPFGNLTITVAPDGEVSLRLPKPLEHLANAPHGRYVLSGTAVFSYRADEWRARITGGQSGVLHDHPQSSAGPAATSPPPGPARQRLSDGLCSASRHGEVRCARPGRGGGPQRRTPRGAAPRHPRQPGRSTAPHRCRPIRVIGTSRSTGPACDHPAVPLHQPPRHRHHRGRGPRLRRRPHHGPRNHGPRRRAANASATTVAGIPTAVFRHRLTAQTHRRGIRLYRGQPGLHQRVGRPALAHPV